MSVAPIDPLNHLTSFPKGLTAIVGPRHLQMMVMTAVVKEAATAGRNFGLKFERSKVVNLLVPGTQREVQRAKALHAGNALGADAAKVRFVPIGLRKDYDYFSQEGISSLRAMLRAPGKEPDVWIFGQSLDGDLDLLKVDGIARLRTTATTTKSRVLAIMACEQPSQESRITDLFDESILVEACEADVDGGIAFSFDCAGLRELNHFGLGKVMCTLKFGDGNRYERTFTPFVAKTLLDRAIRTLHCNDMSMAEIGEIVGLDKSNVSRRLDGWQPRNILMVDGWPERIAEYFATGGGSRRAAIQDDGVAERKKKRR